MPIYEYQCDACGKTFDALQKLSDAPLTECRQCGAASVRKLISAPAFRLKGSGWYETDFKKDGQRNVAKAETEASGGGGATKSPDSGSSQPAKAAEGTSTSKAADKPKPKPTDGGGKGKASDAA